MWKRRRPNELTPRECEVLKFVRLGLTNEEIAKRLGITVRGVKYHVSEILSKLGVGSREEAVAWRPEEHGWYWKLGWIGGASIGVGAVAGLAAILSYSPNEITLESGGVAADSITGATTPAQIGRTSEPVDQSAPDTASPSSSPPADAGQPARASSLTVVGPGGVPLPPPRPTPMQTPVAPAPTDVDRSSPPPPSPPATPTPTPEPPAPRLSLDMDPSGNSYSDPGTGGDNSMTVGTIDNCLTTAAPGNNNTHTHPVHVVIRDVEDLVGWQIRMNYDGGKMRPNTVNFTPFADTDRSQNLSFVNLPIDSTTGVHRDVVSGINIPPASPGPQTAFIGSVYHSVQNFAISPDTPPKIVPDDASYSAPTGGVLATLNLQVLAGNAGGPSLFMNLDDNVPNAPGSTVIVFTGTGISGTIDIDLTPAQLGDGYHAEGATCAPLDCVTQECALQPAAPTVALQMDRQHGRYPAS